MCVNQPLNRTSQNTEPLLTALNPKPLVHLQPVFARVHVALLTLLVYVAAAALADRAGLIFREVGCEEWV